LRAKQKKEFLKRRGAEVAGEEEAGIEILNSLFVLAVWRLSVMDLNEISAAIIGAAIEVHRRLGPGLLESAYRVCLAYEMRKRGFEVEEERPVPLVYDTVKLECGFRADLVVNRLVVVELKAKSAIHPVDEAQLLSHLRLLGLKLGLLINFHEVKLIDGLRRVVNGF
jgi:GxxExxY protein